MKGAFDALDKYVQITCKTKTVGEAMNDLLNPALLNKLPGWDKPLLQILLLLVILYHLYLVFLSKIPR
jgi:hypothetical protein